MISYRRLDKTPSPAVERCVMFAVNCLHLITDAEGRVLYVNAAESVLKI